MNPETDTCVSITLRYCVYRNDLSELQTEYAVSTFGKIHIDISTLNSNASI